MTDARLRLTADGLQRLPPRYDGGLPGSGMGHGQYGVAGARGYGVQMAHRGRRAAEVDLGHQLLVARMRWIEAGLHIVRRHIFLPLCRCIN